MGSILDMLTSPADVKILGNGDLELLGGEIREFLIETVTSNGGHLASSLGVVELTMALHRVFETPRDKIIWDVGHQCYSHKIITGRRCDFSTLRQFQGLSGFPDRNESPHDSFGGGHAGTSISAALGMAVARDLDQENHNVIAVIGDGSMGAGMAFEAVNHAGHLGSRLIIVLNDNGISISPRIGSLYHLLNSVRFNPCYEATKREFRKGITRLPYGSIFFDMTKKIKKHFSDIVFPPSVFKDLGFTYLGPIDGHDIDQLEAALLRARDFESKPVIVHVMTTKGKGYTPAETNSIKYHGVSPRVSRKTIVPSYNEVFARTLTEIMSNNKKVVAVSAAMLEGTCLTSVQQMFPDRVFDVGICEQHAVTFAAGLAAEGYIPVVAIYSTFLQRSYDQIVNDVCLQKLPVIFAVDRAGIVGDDGKTHQGMFDLSYLRSIPELTLCSPKDGAELRDLLHAAVSAGSPFAIRFPRGSAISTPSADAGEPIFAATGELLRQGRDAALIAIGSAVHPSLEAAEMLSAQGIDCSVVNARFVKPLDESLILEIVRETKHVFTIEENTVTGGFGSAVLELLSRERIFNIPITCIGLPDEFIAHGPQEHLRSLFGLNAAGIADTIQKAMRVPMEIF